MKQLHKDVKDSLITIKLNNITPTMIEAIERVVYDAHTYEGKYGYERRKSDGGLTDPDNIKMTFENKGSTDSVEVVIRNMTVGNKDYEGSVYHWGKSYTYEIDRIIVSGVGYSWTESAFYKNKMPRDFYEATRKEVEDYLHEKITTQLILKGW